MKATRRLDLGSSAPSRFIFPKREQDAFAPSLSLAAFACDVRTGCAPRRHVVRVALARAHAACGLNHALARLAVRPLARVRVRQARRGGLL